MTLPDKKQQVRQVHAMLIVEVVKTCHNKDNLSKLRPVLQASREKGWANLVDAIEQILQGHTNSKLLQNLDEEDSIIIDAILQGLQNPSTLPNPQTPQDPKAAAPGLAHMIYAASQGQAQAIQALTITATQMRQAGGDMTRLSALLRPLLDGERDANKLCQNLSPLAEKLLLDILENLNKLEQSTTH